LENMRRGSRIIVNPELPREISKVQPNVHPYLEGSGLSWLQHGQRWTHVRRTKAEISVGEIARRNKNGIIHHDRAGSGICDGESLDAVLQLAESPKIRGIRTDLKYRRTCCAAQGNRLWREPSAESKNKIGRSRAAGHSWRKHDCDRTILAGLN